ncbi:MAG: hypothetical protein N2376_14145 [Clostridia bacterium]|nr:hypothetical protein [Clostridia bacterium]
MNERNKTSKLRAVMNYAAKKFMGMNKGSKLMLKVAALIFFAFLLVSLFLAVAHLTGLVRFDGQVQLIQWIVLYSFRFWVLLVFGALILDTLINR